MIHGSEKKKRPDRQHLAIRPHLRVHRHPRSLLRHRHPRLLPERSPTHHGHQTQLDDPGLPYHEHLLRQDLDSPIHPPHHRQRHEGPSVVSMSFGLQPLCHQLDLRGLYLRAMPARGSAVGDGGEGEVLGP